MKILLLCNISAPSSGCHIDLIDLICLERIYCKILKIAQNLPLKRNVVYTPMAWI